MCCQKARMVLSSVVDYFNDGGSNFAGLDVSKAFNYVNHCRIFIQLMSANIAVCVLNTLVNWYSKLSGCIKWASVCSQHFYMRCSVRLVSVISPLLFNFGCIFKIKKGLRMNVSLNCRKFLVASLAMLQRCEHLSEPVLCEIVLT